MAENWTEDSNYRFFVSYKGKEYIAEIAKGGGLVRVLLCTPVTMSVADTIDILEAIKQAPPQKRPIRRPGTPAQAPMNPAVKAFAKIVDTMQERAVAAGVYNSRRAEADEAMQRLARSMIVIGGAALPEAEIAAAYEAAAAALDLALMEGSEV